MLIRCCVLCEGRRPDQGSLEGSLSSQGDGWMPDLSSLWRLPRRAPGVTSPELALDVPDALEHRQHAEAREHVDRGREQAEVADPGAAREDQADREDHDAHRASGDPDLALDAQ